MRLAHKGTLCNFALTSTIGLAIRFTGNFGEGQ